MKQPYRAIPHITIVFGLMTLTFFAIDRVNRGMAFMTSELSKWVFAVLAVLSIISSLSLIGLRWREDERKRRAAETAREEAEFLASVRAAEEGPPAPDTAEAESKQAEPQEAIEESEEA